MSKSNDDLAILILNYLESEEKFTSMTPKEKAKVFKIYNDILECFYKCLVFENVYPILLVQNYKSKEIIWKALREVELIIPTVRNIKIEVVNWTNEINIWYWN